MAHKPLRAKEGKMSQQSEEQFKIFYGDVSNPICESIPVDLMKARTTEDAKRAFKRAKGAWMGGPMKMTLMVRNTDGQYVPDRIAFSMASVAGA